MAPLVVADNFKLPAYTSIKILGSYAVGKNFKFSLDIDNVFDKTFYTSSYSQMWVFPGNGRKVTLGAQYKF